MENIIPTKQNPSFIAEFSEWGFIDQGIYKNSLCGAGTTPTFSLDYEAAIKRLHKYIRDNKDFLTEYPKGYFALYAMDGSVLKNGDSELKKVYSISVTNAKKYLL